MKMLTKNFSVAEMQCKCGCGICEIDPQFLVMLQFARDYYGKPMSISSGCRCHKHNKKVGGVADSEHTIQEDGYSHAADILYQDDRELYHIVKSLMMAGFTRIGINRKKKFVHADNSKRKPQEIIFFY